VAEIKTMIVITGAAGFIASCLARRLNDERFFDLVLVDDFSREDKASNFINKRYIELVSRERFDIWLDENHSLVQFVFHLGARTDTTEFDVKIFNELNLNYSKMVWDRCVRYGLPLVYASSAATYGDGHWGYEDQHALSEKLKPLNPYGESKNDFDKWVLQQEKKPFFWAGLKFFNVYGPNEYHKGRMASVVFHAFNQIQKTGKVQLFRSHRSDYADGGQLRDFIYVKDIVSICLYLMKSRPASGIYNAGSGRARSFIDLAQAVFSALGLPPKIDFIDTPADIRDKYQYFTEANMNKLRKSGYTDEFSSLEEGIKEYVQNYLLSHKNY
jgi:ADP-L-glycero-D-manno-heptose 6-epimerase